MSVEPVAVGVAVDGGEVMVGVTVCAVVMQVAVRVHSSRVLVAVGGNGGGVRWGK